MNLPMYSNRSKNIKKTFSLFVAVSFALQSVSGLVAPAFADGPLDPNGNLGLLPISSGDGSQQDAVDQQNALAEISSTQIPDDVRGLPARPVKLIVTGTARNRDGEEERVTVEGQTVALTIVKGDVIFKADMHNFVNGNPDCSDPNDECVNGISEFKTYIDGVLKPEFSGKMSQDRFGWQQYSLNYSVQLPTDTLSEGKHNIRFVATSESGETSEGNLALTIDKLPEPVKPTPVPTTDNGKTGYASRVSMLLDMDESRDPFGYSGNMEIEAWVHRPQGQEDDNNPISNEVAGFHTYIDGAMVGEIWSSWVSNNPNHWGQAVKFDTRKFIDGAHELLVKIIFKDGSTSSSTRPITFRNGYNRSLGYPLPYSAYLPDREDSNKSGVKFIQPNPGAIIEGTAQVSVSVKSLLEAMYSTVPQASQPTVVTSFKFYVDGREVPSYVYRPNSLGGFDNGFGNMTGLGSFTPLPSFAEEYVMAEIPTEGLGNGMHRFEVKATRLGRWVDAHHVWVEVRNGTATNDLDTERSNQTSSDTDSPISTDDGDSGTDGTASDGTETDDTTGSSDGDSTTSTNNGDSGTDRTSSGGTETGGTTGSSDGDSTNGSGAGQDTSGSETYAFGNDGIQVIGNGNHGDKTNDDLQGSDPTIKEDEIRTIDEPMPGNDPVVEGEGDAEQNGGAILDMEAFNRLQEVISLYNSALQYIVDVVISAINGADKNGDGMINFDDAKLHGIDGFDRILQLIGGAILSINGMMNAVSAVTSSKANDRGFDSYKAGYLENLNSLKGWLSSKAGDIQATIAAWREATLRVAYSAGYDLQTNTWTATSASESTGALGTMGVSTGAATTVETSASGLASQPSGTTGEATGSESRSESQSSDESASFENSGPVAAFRSVSVGETVSGSGVSGEATSVSSTTTSSASDALTDSPSNSESIQPQGSLSEALSEFVAPSASSAQIELAELVPGSSGPELHLFALTNGTAESWQVLVGEKVVREWSNSDNSMGDAGSELSGVDVRVPVSGFFGENQVKFIVFGPNGEINSASTTVTFDAAGPGSEELSQEEINVIRESDSPNFGVSPSSSGGETGQVNQEPSISTRSDSPPNGPVNNFFGSSVSSGSLSSAGAGVITASSSGSAESVQPVSGTSPVNWLPSGNTASGLPTGLPDTTPTGATPTDTTSVPSESGLTPAEQEMRASMMDRIKTANAADFPYLLSGGVHFDPAKSWSAGGTFAMPTVAMAKIMNKYAAELQAQVGSNFKVKVGFRQGDSEDPNYPTGFEVFVENISATLEPGELSFFHGTIHVASSRDDVMSGQTVFKFIVGGEQAGTYDSVIYGRHLFWGVFQKLYADMGSPSDPKKLTELSQKATAAMTLTRFKTESALGSMEGVSQVRFESKGGALGAEHYAVNIHWGVQSPWGGVKLTLVSDNQLADTSYIQRALQGGSAKGAVVTLTQVTPRDSHLFQVDIAVPTNTFDGQFKSLSFLAVIQGSEMKLFSHTLSPDPNFNTEINGLTPGGHDFLAGGEGRVVYFAVLNALRHYMPNGSAANIRGGSATQSLSETAIGLLTKIEFYAQGNPGGGSEVAQIPLSSYLSNLLGPNVGSKTKYLSVQRSGEWYEQGGLTVSLAWGAVVSPAFGISPTGPAASSSAGATSSSTGSPADTASEGGAVPIASESEWAAEPVPTIPSVTDPVELPTTTSTETLGTTDIPIETFPTGETFESETRASGPLSVNDPIDTTDASNGSFVRINTELQELNDRESARMSNIKGLVYLSSDTRGDVEYTISVKSIESDSAPEFLIASGSVPHTGRMVEFRVIRESLQPGQYTVIVRARNANGQRNNAFTRFVVEGDPGERSGDSNINESSIIPASDTNPVSIPSEAPSTASEQEQQDEIPWDSDRSFRTDGRPHIEPSLDFSAMDGAQYVIVKVGDDPKGRTLYRISIANLDYPNTEINPAGGFIVAPEHTLGSDTLFDESNRTVRFKIDGKFIGEWPQPAPGVVQNLELRVRVYNIETKQANYAALRIPFDLIGSGDSNTNESSVIPASDTNPVSIPSEAPSAAPVADIVTPTLPTVQPVASSNSILSEDLTPEEIAAISKSPVDNETLDSGKSDGAGEGSSSIWVGEWEWETTKSSGGSGDSGSTNPGSSESTTTILMSDPVKLSIPTGIQIPGVGTTEEAQQQSETANQAPGMSKVPIDEFVVTEPAPATEPILEPTAFSEPEPPAPASETPDILIAESVDASETMIPGMEAPESAFGNGNAVIVYRQTFNVNPNLPYKFEIIVKAPWLGQSNGFEVTAGPKSGSLSGIVQTLHPITQALKVTATYQYTSSASAADDTVAFKVQSTSSPNWRIDGAIKFIFTAVNSSALMFGEMAPAEIDVIEGPAVSASLATEGVDASTQDLGGIIAGATDEVQGDRDHFETERIERERLERERIVADEQARIEAEQESRAIALQENLDREAARLEQERAEKAAREVDEAAQRAEEERLAVLRLLVEREQAARRLVTEPAVRALSATPVVSAPVQSTPVTRPEVPPVSSPAFSAIVGAVSGAPSVSSNAVSFQASPASAAVSASSLSSGLASQTAVTVGTLAASAEGNVTTSLSSANQPDDPAGVANQEADPLEASNASNTDDEGSAQVVSEEALSTAGVVSGRGVYPEGAPTQQAVAQVLGRGDSLSSINSRITNFLQGLSGSFSRARSLMLGQAASPTAQAKATEGPAPEVLDSSHDILS